MSPCELWSQRALCVEMGFYVDIYSDIKLRYSWKTTKFGPSSTLYLTLLGSVKLSAEDGTKFCGLLRISELT